MPCGAGGCGLSQGVGSGISGGGCSQGGCSSGGCASTPTVEIVGVRLPNTARTNHFDSNGHQLELEEPCIIEGDHGPAYAVVTQATSASETYTRRGFPLKKVLRRATFEDREKHEKVAEREREAFEFCRQRILERRLEMKLVNAHFGMDGSKATFFFTGEGRVDFRALVRDVASRHRVRVEMRQIGVRDGARTLGGYGDCGRPLCCSTWLKRFEPITIQMAKAQNLALNPARISGMCGRLKCCLRYEYVPPQRPRKGKKGQDLSKLRGTSEKQAANSSDS